MRTPFLRARPHAATRSGTISPFRGDSLGSRGWTHSENGTLFSVRSSRERKNGRRTIENPTPCGIGFSDHSTKSLNHLGKGIGDKLVGESTLGHFALVVVGVVFAGRDDEFVTGMNQGARTESVEALEFVN